MKSAYEFGAISTPPAVPSSPSLGSPTGGNPGTGTPATTPGAYWFHAVTMEIVNTITAAGLTPDVSNLSQLEQAIRLLSASVVASGVPSGSIMYHRRNAAPAGWVELRAGTIGNASSGASIRANADTSALFALIWDESDNTIAPVYAADGSPSVRGASAAADFAAAKRIALDDCRADFLRALDSGRGVDSGRVLGSAQDWSTGAPKTTTANHLNSDGSVSSTLTRATNPSVLGFARISKSGEDVTPSGADSSGSGNELDYVNVSGGDPETRPRNRAYLLCIKL